MSHDSYSVKNRDAAGRVKPRPGGPSHTFRSTSAPRCRVEAVFSERLAGKRWDGDLRHRASWPDGSYWKVLPFPRSISTNCNSYTTRTGCAATSTNGQVTVTAWSVPC